ncbi:MAG: M28 family peptidase [bacterium]
MQKWLLFKLSSYAFNVKTDTFTYHARFQKADVKLMNIIVSVKGIIPACYMVCAHYDTRPWADRDPNPGNRLKPIPGANDGASGVAVLLELARLFHLKKPYYSVDLVFFDGEDFGQSGLDSFCIGSGHYATSLKPGAYKGSILLDMVGDKNLEIPWEGYSFDNAPELIHSIWGFAEKMNIKAFVSRKGYYIFDDHVPLIKRGIPAVDIIDFDYKYWHTLQDTPDKCSPGSLESVGCVVTEFLYGGAAEK